MACLVSGMIFCFSCPSIAVLDIINTVTTLDVHTVLYARGRGLPEEILLAIDITVPDEALLAERLAAVGTLQTFGMPVVVQHLQDEPVQDEETASDALGNCGYGNQTLNCHFFQSLEKKKEQNKCVSLMILQLESAVRI